jgi:hypothetical protein
MPIYYVSTGIGCNLIEAKNKEQARRYTLWEVGSVAGVQLVRLATKEDINWVLAMQGKTKPCKLQP